MSFALTQVLNQGVWSNGSACTMHGHKGTRQFELSKICFFVFLFLGGEGS